MPLTDLDPAILFDLHPEAMWVYDRQTLRFLAVNDTAISRYGYSRDAFLAMTIADIRPEDERKRLQANLDATTGDAFERSGTWRHIRKSGEALYVDVVSNAITFDGRPARLVIARDVTARTSIEANLHQAQSQLRLANWELDLTTDTAHWPPRVYELVGVEPQSFSNTREAFLALVHPADRERYIAAQERAIAQRTLFNEQFRILHPSGEVRFLHEVGEVIATDDRPVFSAVVQDVTDLVASHEKSARLVTQLHDILEAMADGFFMLDREWRYSYVNKRAAEITGKPREKIEGGTVWEAFPELVGTSFEALFLKARRSGETQRLTEYYPPLERWLEVSVHPGTDNMAVYFRDVTEDIHAARRRRLLDTAIENLGESVIITEMTANGPSMIYVNDALTRMSGYPPDAMIGRNPKMFQGPDSDGPELDRLRAAIAAQRSEKVRLLNYTRTKTPYWVELALSPVWNDDGDCTHFIAIQRDITKSKETEDALMIAATRDDLTGLFNRVVLRETLERSLEALRATDGSLALLFLDLDNFKNANDTMGHEPGDTLLSEVARRISHAVRNSDMVARMSGDEFMVLATGATAEDASRLAKRLLDTFRMPFDVSGREIALTASIGIVVAPEDGDNTETLIRNVDIALYRSKTDGRNMATRFTPAMRADLVRRTELEQALQKSLLADAGDFWLVYQPQVTCDAGRRVIGGEALLRWTGPETGPVGPGAFIPIAEATGLIRPLDHKVIELAARQIAAWTREGIAVPISVNVSAISMQTAGFAQELLQRLDTHGVPHELFQVEIVETAYLDESTTTRDNLAILSRAGISLSIDDFGTGHSSLSYLRRMPVRFLKMDRGFVAPIGTGSQPDDALAEAILAMARALQLDVLAEGVETDAQFDWLARNGCTGVQGFFTGQPLEPKKFARLCLKPEVG